MVSRSGWSNQGGVELFLDDPGRAGVLWDAVAEAGEPFGIGPGAPNPQERIENVLLSYGTDTGYKGDPIELGLEPHLDLDGPPFVGQGALQRIRDEGPSRRLVGVVVGGDRLETLWRPAAFFADDGTEVGQLRSAVWSPAFQRNLGLALLDAKQQPGDRGVVDLGDGERECRLVELPFDDEPLPSV